jgi:hypothetical protein
MAGPARQRTPKIISDFLRPRRSTIKPPITTVKMLGETVNRLQEADIGIREAELLF